YGNLVTNIKSADLSGIQLNSSQLMLGSTTLTSGKTYYGEAAEGESSFVINSSGYLEIFQNKGNAALTLRSSLLDIVKINSNR
ncbi:MAG: SAM-dependent chlorinase/fluorinase, partial [Nitrospirae bacterium]|nr:SAM-dependent chlorinase/fluorinase [Nitrospirota bacterium]